MYFFILQNSWDAVRSDPNLVCTDLPLSLKTPKLPSCSKIKKNYPKKIHLLNKHICDMHFDFHIALSNCEVILLYLQIDY